MSPAHKLVKSPMTCTGWTVGGGAEWMFAPHWSVFAEYNFMGFGTRSEAFTTCGVVNCAVGSQRQSEPPGCPSRAEL